MRHPRLLTSQNAVLLIVDVQERFRAVMGDFPELIKNISILAKACKILKVPVVVTEQYPQGLGSTVAEIQAALGEHKQFEKSCFSTCGSIEFDEWLKQKNRKQIIVSGIEAHVCVSQSVHDLLARDYQVHVVTDAIASRIPRNKEVGIQKMTSSGALFSSVEMALFEMLQESGTDDFKAVQKLVK